MYYSEEITKKLLSEARCKRERILNVVSVILSLLVTFLFAYASYLFKDNSKIAEAVSEYTGINIEFISFLSAFSSYAILAVLIIVFLTIIFYNLSYRIHSGLKNFGLDDIPDSKVFELFKEYCKVLDIEEPIPFINSSVYDSTVFGIKIRGKKAIGIPVKAYQQAAVYHDYHIFNYRVCSMLGDIYLGHYDVLFQLSTFWARLIPIYGNFYTRALSYSTDRVAQILIGTKSLVTAIGKETSGLFFVDDETMNKILDPRNVVMTKSEKFVAIIYGLTDEYPLPYFRLRRIIENDIEDQKLIKQEEKKMKKVDEIKENDLKEVTGGSDYGDINDEDDKLDIGNNSIIGEVRIREHHDRHSKKREKRKADVKKARKY